MNRSLEDVPTAQLPGKARAELRIVVALRSLGQSSGGTCVHCAGRLDLG